MIQAAVRDVTVRVKQSLADSHLVELRSLRVEQHGNRCILQGRVGSFYAKQMAQETVRPFVRGLRLVNAVAVD
ncbi:MAG: BON domain-containing protein [Pirellulales bacterium]